MKSIKSSGLRSAEVTGVCVRIREGFSLILVAPPLQDLGDGAVRVVETSPVTAIVDFLHVSVVFTASGSVYYVIKKREGSFYAQ
jgi:hypothetical protein